MLIRPRPVLAAAMALALLSTFGIGFALPGMLLHPSCLSRTRAEECQILARLTPAGAQWTVDLVPGGGGIPLRVHWLHRQSSRGVAVILHGFGDDAFGSAPRLLDFPDLDAVVFTFRGRDLDPTVPVTLGAWERKDVDAVVGYLAGHGIPRNRMLLIGTSQGAGVALLALEDLEHTGAPLGGALLESPFLDLRDATRNHLRGTLGRAEILARPAESIALWRAGQVAGFDPASVSPFRASQNLRTPMAFIAGDADGVTPLAGVEAIAHGHPDLTVVAGAGHLEAGMRFPGGWKAWAKPRLIRWGF